ncbi:MAG: four helix bundle protein [Candidatus Gastranaerophilaceae bacterium]
MQLVKNFGREYKYTLGEKIENEAISLVICVYKANQKERRESAIQEMLEHIQLLELFLRIAHDLKIISMEHYVQVVEMIDNISRQSQGWLNSINGKTPELVQAKT